MTEKGTELEVKRQRKREIERESSEERRDGGGRRGRGGF